MAGRTLDWQDDLERWLRPFVDRLRHKSRRRMCPLYVSGLIGPGDRKSIQPMAKRLALGECDQLHHFIAAGVWDAAPVETELLVQADRLVGGSDAVLVIDDTAIPKKGTHSVGVAAQYASALALLWQIYSRRCTLQIHFRQCGHRCGGGRVMSSRMAWRTAGKVGCGGGPLILFFPPCCFEPAILEESVSDHRHERVTMQTLPGSSFEVI